MRDWLAVNGLGLLGCLVVICLLVLLVFDADRSCTGNSGIHRWGKYEDFQEIRDLDGIKGTRKVRECGTCGSESFETFH
jgi:hypothetical protein